MALETSQMNRMTCRSSYYTVQLNSTCRKYRVQSNYSIYLVIPKTASGFFSFSLFFFDGDELRRLCVCGEGGGHSGTLLCCPAVTLLWNDVTARKWRRTGSHYWSFSNYFILNKYSRKTPMARATSQLVCIAALIRSKVRSRRWVCKVQRQFDNK